jgi:MYXO-CTERM domain-containing protein
MAAFIRFLSPSILILLAAPSVSAEPGQVPDGPELIGASEEGPVEVFGGMPSAVCGWPSTVSMQGMCTGTLVNPEVVIFAAHCGQGYNSVQFGENGDNPAKSVPTEFCRTFPGGGPGNGQDFAVCKLAEPVLDVPIVPILMGCETEWLQPGAAVTIVGFGFADDNTYGTKREVVTTINMIDQNNEIHIGGGGKDSCQGDSGGPVFIQAPDGSWRVFGITSYGGSCGTGGVYSMMHMGMDWFESETGVDLTPCGDAAGNWLATDACANFQTNPGNAGGAWQTGCMVGPTNGPSTTCGEGGKPDTTPPTVVITAPPDGMQYDAPGGADITVFLDAQDAESGVQEVHLLINGAEIPGGVDFAAPYEFNAVFPTGQYELGATAQDKAGNVGVAVPVHISVNQTPEDPTNGSEESGGTGDAGSGEGGSDDTGGDDSPTDDSASASATATATATATAPTGFTDPGGDEDGDEGCGCRSGQDPKASLLALAGLGMWFRRRRR